MKWRRMVPTPPAAPAKRDLLSISLELTGEEAALLKRAAHAGAISLASDPERGASPSRVIALLDHALIRAEVESHD